MYIIYSPEQYVEQHDHLFNKGYFSIEKLLNDIAENNLPESMTIRYAVDIINVLRAKKIEDSTYGTLEYKDRFGDI